MCFIRVFLVKYEVWLAKKSIQVALWFFKAQVSLKFGGFPGFQPICFFQKDQWKIETDGFLPQIWFLGKTRSPESFPLCAMSRFSAFQDLLGFVWRTQVGDVTLWFSGEILPIDYFRGDIRYVVQCIVHPDGIEKKTMFCEPHGFCCETLPLTWFDWKKKKCQSLMMLNSPKSWGFSQSHHLNPLPNLWLSRNCLPHSLPVRFKP